MAAKNIEKEATNPERVMISLPISEEEQDDVWVCINGKGTLIQRGVDVWVTKDVAEVLANANKQKRVALNRSLELQKTLKTMR